MYKPRRLRCAITGKIAVPVIRKQLYNFAGLSIFIDKDLTFAFDPADRSWRPLALEDLLARARAPRS